MKIKMSYEKALEIAKGCVDDLAPYCERIEIAGSLRRRKAEVGDIEIVCIPKYSGAGVDLFGAQAPARNMLEEQTRTYRLLKNGPNYKKLSLASIDVDLFITTPEQWGVIFTIRTGSADFSHWLVTHKQQGGALPGWMSVHNGRVWDYLGHSFQTSEERDFFNVINLGWIEPEKRIEGNWIHG